ncbi:hypothetical protein MFU01_79560 [Myxococcus fulvus]|uniref:Uncharacterized protein n=1 Tax=Myxococcus fulvus TaxID=33 RepID=A0A511TFG8_MYXFU|nr:hypothetical protein MFU01_79560 [Myxococcus fulvus]
MSQRSTGTSRIASYPSHRRRQNEATSGAPGMRHARPTTAMGSSTGREADVVAAGRDSVSARPDSAADSA